MLKYFPFYMFLSFMLSACLPTNSKPAPVVTDGFVQETKGGNSLLHQPGTIGLYRIKAGVKTLIWPDLQSFPDNVDGVVIFNVALEDGDPNTVLACDSDGLPVKINEMVTRKCCVTRGIDYSTVAGTLYYYVGLNRMDTDTVKEKLFAFGSTIDTPEHNFNVKISPEEVRQWIREDQKIGIKKIKDGSEYM